MAVVKERLEARVSRDQKRLLQEAAQLRGQSLTDFVISSVQEAAKRTIEEWHVLSLTRQDRQVFARALLAAPPPNARLRKAVRRSRMRVGR